MDPVNKKAGMGRPGRAEVGETGEYKTAHPIEIYLCVVVGFGSRVTRVRLEISTQEFTEHAELLGRGDE
jgi:hypothetical protein